MNAIQPSRPPLQPVNPRRVAHSVNRRRRLSPYRFMVIENTAKLTVSVVLSVVTVSSLIKLLPYQWSQQEKLWEVQTEVKLTEGRVNHLRTDFNRYFDPQQTKSIMQEQSNRVNPGQRQVVLPELAARKVEE